MTTRRDTRLEPDTRFMIRIFRFHACSVDTGRFYFNFSHTKIILLYIIIRNYIGKNEAKIFQTSTRTHGLLRPLLPHETSCSKNLCYICVISLKTNQN